MQKTVVIPAYEPDERLVALVGGLIGHFPVLVVDDGSGETYAGLFEQVEALGALVLRHEVNRGKGAALKTAFKRLLDQPCAAITADADGQHTVQDILAIAAALDCYADTLILGVRDLSGMPPRSRFGNTVTRFAFRAVTGLAISDTQTGLRGIPASLMERMLGVAGDRYEYELNMLLSLKPWGVPFKEIPIETIYLDGNRSSHFHSVRDGLRVFSQLFKFTLSSLGCALLDYGLYCLLLLVLAPAWSYALARIFSAVVNYQLVRRVVFRAESSTGKAVSYMLLAGFSMAAGSAGTALLVSLGIHSVLSKLILDALLFVLNYLVQKKLIFRKQPSAA